MRAGRDPMTYDEATKGEIYPWYPPELDGAADEPWKHEAENG